MVDLSYSSSDPLRAVATPGSLTPGWKGGGGLTTWRCNVSLDFGTRHVLFTGIGGAPVRWTARRKPGETVQVNPRQLKHLIKQGVARSRRKS